MGNRTRIFEGQNKWGMILFSWLEGTIILLIVSLIFLPPLFNIIFWPSWIIVGVVLNWSIPMYLKQKHQGVASEKEFHECIIRWSKFDWEEFLLGFTRIVEITPDWSDTNLIKFQESRDFTIYLQRYLTRTLIEDFHANLSLFNFRFRFFGIRFGIRLFLLLFL